MTETDEQARRITQKLDESREFQRMYDYVWDRGRDARREGKPLSACPYEAPPWSRDAWRAGWADEDMGLKATGGSDESTGV